MIIDCDSCRARGPACGDCMVTAILGPPGRGPVVIDGQEQLALSALAASGMVPPLRLVPVERGPDRSGGGARGVRRRAAG